MFFFFFILIVSVFFFIYRNNEETDFLAALLTKLLTVYGEAAVRHGFAKSVGHSAAVRAAVRTERVDDRQPEDAAVAHRVRKVFTVGYGHVVFEPRGAHRNCTCKSDKSSSGCVEEKKMI